MRREIRTLCASCKSEYLTAGYELRLIWQDKKEPCDRCRVKTGWMYEVRPHRKKKS